MWRPRSLPRSPPRHADGRAGRRLLLRRRARAGQPRRDGPDRAARAPVHPALPPWSPGRVGARPARLAPPDPARGLPGADVGGARAAAPRTLRPGLRRAAPPARQGPPARPRARRRVRAARGRAGEPGAAGLLPHRVARRLTALDPDERSLAALLAQLWLYHGAPEKARTLLRGAVRLAPGEPELLKLLAWAEVACGDGDAALAAVERYRVAEPFADEASPIELIRARALLLAGRAEEARAGFARFLRARAALE